MKRKLLILFGVLVILMVPVGTVFAQDAVAPTVCTGESVAGTVVAVDEETGDITVEDEDGNQCVLAAPADYEHPITSLLDAYFGEASTEKLAGAFDSLDVCAVYDAVSDTWTTVEVEEGEACEGTEVTVSGENEDGTFAAADEAGTEVVLTFGEEDEDAAGDLADALGALVIDWSLDEDGNVSDAGDDITTYREEDGIGYGVLVKVYAIAAESTEACEAEAEEAAEGEDAPAADATDAEEACGVSTDELVELLENGAGLGKLFQIYGKPAMLGVGHVRQALNADASGDTAESGDDEEECKSGGGHDMGTHTGHVDCVNEGGGTGLPSGDKANNDKDDGEDD